MPPSENGFFFLKVPGLALEPTLGHIPEPVTGALIDQVKPVRLWVWSLPAKPPGWIVVPEESQGESEEGGSLMGRQKQQLCTRGGFPDRTLERRVRKTVDEGAGRSLPVTVPTPGPELAWSVPTLPSPFRAHPSQSRVCHMLRTRCQGQPAGKRE